MDNKVGTCYGGLGSKVLSHCKLSLEGRRINKVFWSKFCLGILVIKASSVKFPEVLVRSLKGLLREKSKGNWRKFDVVWEVVNKAVN